MLYFSSKSAITSLSLATNLKLKIRFFNSSLDFSSNNKTSSRKYRVCKLVNFNTLFIEKAKYISRNVFKREKTTQSTKLNNKEFIYHLHDPSKLS